MIKGNKNKDEIIEMFYGFDVTEYEDRKARECIEQLTEKNKLLKQNLTILERKLSNINYTINHSKKISYSEMKDRLYNSFDFLQKNSLASLITAEYIFLNETDKDMDYTGVYLGYVKSFEIELRKRIEKKGQSLTLGGLILRLKNHPELRTFIDALDRVKVVSNRNKAVHNHQLSKIECGRLRDVLITNGWLDRICYVLDDKFIN